MTSKFIDGWRGVEVESDNESDNLNVSRLSIIDLYSESTSEQINELVRACESIGAFFVKSPYLDTDFLMKIKEMMREYFSLEEHEKMENYIGKSNYHRGYFPTFEENAKDSDLKDFKEGFDFALHLPPDKEYPLHGPNVYSNTPTAFKKLSDEFFYRLIRTSEHICKYLAIGIGEEPNFFVPFLTKPLAQLRLLKYPSSSPKKPLLGAGAHTDYGLITLIWQDEVGGLEVKTREGDFYSIKPEEGYILCFLGDMMQRLTNDEWRALEHRVVNQSSVDRFSAAFFFEPNFDAIIKPLDQFICSQNPSRYEPITMGEYLMDGFNGTFSYRNKSN